MIKVYNDVSDEEILSDFFKKKPAGEAKGE